MSMSGVEMPGLDKNDKTDQTSGAIARATTTYRPGNMDDLKRDMTLIQGAEFFEDSGFPVPLFRMEFHVETLRLIGHIGIITMLLTGAFLTTKFVNPRIPPETTTLYEIFGFNHACNLIDHHPSREVASIMLPFFTVPIALYIFFFWLRVEQAASKEEIPRWLLIFVRVTTPYNFVVNALLHMWFVNNPDDEYGFVAHYIPYVMWQIELACQAVSQVAYLSAKNDLPCGVSRWVGMAFAGSVVGITFITIVITCAIVEERPILDSKNNPTHRSILKSMSYLYFILTVLAPVPFAAVHRKNGDTLVIALGTKGEASMAVRGSEL